MKRCPQCNRAETDDALAFCRTDGAPLVSDSLPLPSEAGTVPFGETAAEFATSLLPHATAGSAGGPTTALPAETVPSATRELTKSKRGWIAVAFVIFAALVISAGGYFYFTNKPQSTIDSIAVMPFINESGNPDIEYLSDGITETLIRSLSQLPNLNVKARSSVFRYKGKVIDLKTIANELNVQAVLNGRVIQRGEQLTLSLELIDAQTENVIWTDQYDRRSADLVSLQNEIARDVSSKLKTKLSGADEQKLAKTYTTNTEAYKLYLQGRFYWNKREEKDFRKALEFYGQAIAHDRNYVLAYAGLADTYALLSTFGFMPPTEGVPKAREFARQALSLDESLAEPHTTLKEGNNNWVMTKAYVDLGEKDKAFVELNEAYNKRLSSLCWLKVEPLLEPLRSDWRYQELLRKMNFPQ